MTENKYWIFLEQLRRSGVVNMYGAGLYLEAEFGLDATEARLILNDWMNNYNRSDYDGM